MPRPKKVQVELDLTIYTKSGKLRKRKRKQTRNYFTQDTEDAILNYLKEENVRKKNEIFNEKINYGLHKLAENIIHTFKFYYTEVDNVEQLKHEVVTFLIQKLHLYDPNKGKAYSYFGTIAKHWLIVYNEDNYKRQKAHADLLEVDEDKSTFIKITNAEAESELIEFIDKYIFYIESNVNQLFEKEVDIKICNAVLELFKKRENLEVINKQASYIYIKEITGNTAPQITKVIKVLKEVYKNLMNEYYLTGDIYM